MENMNILLNYIKTLEKLLLKLINENNIKSKQINKKIQNLIIILSQNGLKPNEIESCMDENNNNNNNNLKYSDYDTDNEEIDETYTHYFLDENLKENILEFFHQKHISMKQLGLKISDFDFEEKEENNINNDLIENNYLNKKKEREKNINESDNNFNKEN